MSRVGYYSQVSVAFFFFLNTLLKTKRIICIHGYGQTGPSSNPCVFSTLHMCRVIHCSQAGQGRIFSNFVPSCRLGVTKGLNSQPVMWRLTATLVCFCLSWSMELCCFQATFQFSCFDFKLSLQWMNHWARYYLSNKISEPTCSTIPPILCLHYYLPLKQMGH